MHPWYGKKTSAKDIKSSSRHGDAGGRAQGATGWARRGCLPAFHCRHHLPTISGGAGGGPPIKSTLPTRPSPAPGANQISGIETHPTKLEQFWSHTRATVPSSPLTLLWDPIIFWNPEFFVAFSSHFVCSLSQSWHPTFLPLHCMMFYTTYKPIPTIIPSTPRLSHRSAVGLGAR